MRLPRPLGILLILLAGVVLATPAGAGSAAGGDFYARIRANDAPIAGRFTIVAYFLDSLDVAVPMPGPGRVLALHFRDSNGQNAFVIPGDLELHGSYRTQWTGGFVPLGARRLGGALAKGEGRWALWWVPQGQDTLVWAAPRDLKLEYGFSGSTFVPLDPKDAKTTLAALPWDEIAAARIDPDRTTGTQDPPDPAAFDTQPEVKKRRDPEYPRIARFYDFEGVVHVVARVTPEGQVEDAYVLQSTALHELKVAALVAVMDWIFKPGRKSGEPTSGDVVIPVVFSLGTIK